MVAAGHQVLFTTKDKECAVDLLRAYSLPFELLGKPFSGAAGKLYGLWHFGKKLWKIAKEFDADMFISISSMYAAHVSSLMRKPHMVMDDTEHSTFEHWLYKPFSEHILTPTCFEKHMGPKHIKYDGYHELAYLHPLRFKPNQHTIASLGLDEGQPYSLLRFVSWNAGHDLKAGGLSMDEKMELVRELSSLGRVFISSEKELPAELEQYRIRIKPEEMHTVLQHARVYVGEGASMASECAMLGTPAIYVNSLNAGTLKEQEAYGLIYSFRNYDGVLDVAKAVFLDDEFANSHTACRDRMMSEKVDVTALLCRLSEEVFADTALSNSLYTKLNFKTSQ
jgi:predicted glycosyltransferase